MQTISESYILGIGEGRASLDAHMRNGLSRDEAIDAEIANLRAQLARGFGPDMRDYFRGSLDFFLRRREDRAAQCAL